MVNWSISWQYSRFQLRTLILVLFFYLQVSAENALEGKIVEFDGKPYYIGSLLGAGNIGQVFLAESIVDENDKKAIKLVNPRNGDTDLEYLNRITLKSHLGIMLIDPLGEHLQFSPKVFIIAENASMPFIQATRIRSRVPPGSRFLIVSSEAQASLKADMALQSTVNRRMRLALKVLVDVYSELDFLGSKKFTHGDVKPVNIMRGKNGKYGLIDYDSASRVGSQIRLSTSFYAPPEVFNQGRTSKEIDLFALGMTALQILHPEIVNDHRRQFLESPEQLKKMLAGFQKAIETQYPNLKAISQTTLEFIEASLTLEPQDRASRISGTHFVRAYTQSRVARQNGNPSYEILFAVETQSHGREGNSCLGFYK